MKFKPSRKFRQRIGVQTAVYDLANAARSANDQRARRGFRDSLQASDALANRIRLCRCGLQAPNAIERCRPQRAIALLVQIADSAAEAAIGALALDRSCADRAQ